ncbi:hypothetical protein [Labrys neptuniae]
MANICPHCGEAPCLSVRRKLTLGPTGSARCLACDCKVGVAFGPAAVSMAAIWLLLLALAFLILLRLALASIDPDAAPIGAMLAVAGLLAIALAVHWFGVPLRIDELSDVQTVAQGRARVAARAGAR